MKKLLNLKISAKITRILLVVLILFHLDASAQYDFTTFDRQGTETYDIAGDIQKIPAGGYLMVGDTKEGSSSKRDVLVTRFDNCMNVIWSKTYGYPNLEEYGAKFAITPEGDFIVSSTHKNVDNNLDHYFFKININGEIIWQNTYDQGPNNPSYNNGNLNEWNRYIMPLPDNKYMYIGTIHFGGAPSNRMLYGRIDPTGGIYEGANWIHFPGVNDNGYHGCIGGNNDRFVVGNYDDLPGNSGLLLNLDDDLALNFNKRYSVSGYNNLIFKSINPTTGGNFIISGTLTNNGDLNSDILILCINSLGEVQWHKVYSTSGEKSDLIYFGERSENGGGVFAGRIQNSIDVNDNDYLVFKINNLGDILWSKTIASPNENNILTTIRSENYEYIAAGLISTSTGTNIPVFRIGLNGENCELDDLILEEITETVVSINGLNILTSNTPPDQISLNAEPEIIQYNTNNFCPSTASITPPLAVACANDYTTLTALPSGLSYAWSTGETSESISVTPNVSTVYSVTVTYPSGCSLSASNDLTVNSNPNITFITGSTNIACGQNTTISATGCSNCSYTWSPGGATTSSISVSPVSTTTYTVTATNEFGCTASASQTITVNEGCFDGAYCMQIIKENNNDIGYAIERTTDGGYVIVGSMYSNDGLSNKDVYVVKFSSTMVQEFAYRLGGEYGDEGISILPRSDGYFIAGTIKISPTESDIFILKLNTNGTLSWSNRYGNNNGSQESACKIITASNNGLMVIGSSNSGGNYNVLALKLNTNGTIASKKIFSTASLTSNEIAYDAIKVGSGVSAYYIITGAQYTSVADKNMFALKIKEDYTIVDNRIIANTGKSEIGYSITSTPTSIYIAGTINSPINGYNDVYLVGLNLNNFSLLPVGRVYSIGSNVDIARQIKRMANGDLVIAGTTSVLNNINGFIMRISPSDLSTVIWSKSTNEENRNERFMDFVEGPSNFITITGSWWEETGEDIFISKISSTGYGCCMINKAITSSPLINSISGFISKDIGLHFIPYGTSTSYYNAEVICSKPILGQRVTDNIDGNKIKVFPNPASDKLTIQLENTSEYINEVTIYDISGRSVLNTQSNNTIEVLDVSKLLNGVYVVKVRGESQTWNTLINISK